MKQCLFNHSDELYEKIEEFRWEKRMNKTKAVIFLIEKGLERIEEQNNNL